MNIELAHAVLAYLGSQGVKEYCLCPGRRNAPFVAALEALALANEQIRVFSFFEERSAAFFALGRMKRHGQPVAVCTTSGTACAELLPAAVESWYGGYPLVLLTSDRPRRLRGSGAPQTIEQVGLFASYVSACHDIAEAGEIQAASKILNCPIHLNVCFDEPILEPAEARCGIPASLLAKSGEYVAEHRPVAGPAVANEGRERLRAFLSSAACPLVIVGPLELGAKKSVEDFLIRLGAPVFAESGSQLCGSTRLSGLLIRSGNTFVKNLLERKIVDAALRIGGVPAPRVWRDLDEKFNQIPVCSVSERPFAGLGRGELVHAALQPFLDGVQVPQNFQSNLSIGLIAADDRRERSRIDALIERYPGSEVGMLGRLAKMIPSSASIYLGNSLPVREWDLVCCDTGSAREYAVNRGANGIDGQLSTFLGWCQTERENWAVLGDLTTLYDLSAPWAFSAMSALRARIAVINNGGGQIFSRMFSSKLFLNEHRLNFDGWASMWGMDYARWDARNAGGKFEQGPAESWSKAPHALLEVCPDAEQTASFWRDYELGAR